MEKNKRESPDLDFTIYVTFATRLRAKGVHEMDIMLLLGHTIL